MDQTPADKKPKLILSPEDIKKVAQYIDLLLTINERLKIVKKEDYAE